MKYTHVGVFLGVVVKSAAFWKASRYGLQQSARQWISTFSTFLLAYDLLQSSADPCTFFLTTNSRLILVLWVDDGRASAKNKALLTNTISHLKTVFEVTMGDADVYVDFILHILLLLTNFTSISRGSLKISLPNTDLNTNYDYTSCDLHVPLNYPYAKNVDTLVPLFPYQEIVGSLLYWATHLRPDIVHVVFVIAQYATNFWEIHCTAVKWKIKNLQGTIDFALY